MGQIAESNLGGVALGAASTIPQPLTAIEDGPVAHFLIELSFSLKSTATAFALSILTGLSAGALNADDVDLLLTALFTTFAFYPDGNTLQFQLAPNVLRRVLAYLNVRDYSGSLMRGGSVPVSSGAATAFTLNIVVPVSLQDLFADGQIFQSGSERFRPGYFQYATGASLTPTVVLTNGSAVVSALAINLRVRYGVGSGGDLGQLWQAAVQNNLSNIWNLEGGQPRIGLFDVLAPASNPGVGITIEDYKNTSPNALAGNYIQDRLQMGGYDITAAYTPYLWMKPQTTFAEYATKATSKQPRIEITSGVSSLSLIDIRVLGISPDTAERVARKVSGGGDYTATPVLPRSLPPGAGVAAGSAGMLVQRLSPGKGSGGAATHTKPEAAAQKVGVLNALTGSIRAKNRAVKGKG